jgi:hypothetical protein
MLLGLRIGRVVPFVVGLLASFGCNGGDGNDKPREHCSELQGDGTCVALYPNRPYCSLCEANNNGCLQLPPAPLCSPYEGTSTSDAGSTTEALTSASTGETTVRIDDTADDTTGEPPCAMEGQVDPECRALDPVRPYCIDAVCTGCEAAGGDAFCRGRDVLTPGCAADGECVGCDDAGHEVCVGAAPVCDASGGCLACTAHAQCPAGACHLGADDPLLGRCFLPEEVIYVDNEAPCPGVGTQDEPMCSLTAAAALVAPGDSRVLRVSGGTPYLERAQLDGELTVAIVGDGGVPTIRGNPAQQAASLIFQDGVIAYLRDVNLDGNATTHGATCSFGSLYIEDTRMRGNDGWGLFDFNPCTIAMERVVIANNEDGGVRVSAGTLSLVNSTVAVNGIGASSTGLRLLGGVEAHILYSTIAGNNGSGSDSIECTGTTGTLRNSIVVGVDAPSIALECFPLVMSYNAMDANNFVAGTNVAVGPYNAAYFSSPAQGDMTLSAPPLTPYGGIALWVEGDPRLDIEGTPRPTDGSLGYAGIDEP